MTMSDSLSIMADIGGTNTRVALARDLEVLTDSICRFKNAEYSGLEPILTEYLADRPGIKPTAASAAIAGPVRDGEGTLTNLDWTINRDLLRRATGATTVSVINDLQAQGHAVEHLTDENVETIQEGEIVDAHAARLVVGVGTGFNAAPVFRTNNMTLIPPAECGHVDLPTPYEDQKRFASEFAATNGFCSVEDALSGRGLTHIYGWIAQNAESSARKTAPEIMSACKDGSDTYANDSIQFFSRALGTVCGNLALSHLPFGGIYLVGGVARAVAPYLHDNGFIESFQDKGRFAEFTKQFPVCVVDDDYAALTGMAALLHELRNGPPQRA